MDRRRRLYVAVLVAGLVLGILGLAAAQNSTRGADESLTEHRVVPLVARDEEGGPAPTSVPMATATSTTAGTMTPTATSSPTATMSPSPTATMPTSTSSPTAMPTSCYPYCY